ncbi:MAG: hypothetical protein GY696_02700 [Gammaproteobacteria bacterium]|nr:hypothetical protein [Gammaproteobacteria bacterium]
MPLLQHTYQRIKRRYLLRLLAGAKQEKLIRIGERGVLKAFHRAATTTPFYQTLLNEAGIDAATVKTIEDYQQSAPVLEKENTFGRFTLDQLCNQGQLPDLASVLTSSGHGARFSFGLTSVKQAQQTPEAIDLGLQHAFDVDEKRTLLINCLPMGVRFTSNAVTTAEVSVREDMAVALAKKLGPHYEQLILLGDPLFFKRLIDYSQEVDFDWHKLRTHLIIGEETFGENYRQYLAEKLGVDLDGDDPQMIGSSMGVGELGLNLLFETPETIRLRRQAHANPDFFRQLFGIDPSTHSTPMLFVYNPIRTYIEILDRSDTGYGDLTLSVVDPDAPIPMLRYNTGDAGRLIDPDALKQLMKSQSERENPLPGLPMIAICGRNKDALPDNRNILHYKEALYCHPDIADSLTGAFRLNQSDDNRWAIHIQLGRDKQLTTADQQRLQTIMPSPEIDVVLWNYEQFPYGMTLDYERKFTYKIDT